MGGDGRGTVWDERQMCRRISAALASPDCAAWRRELGRTKTAKITFTKERAVARLKIRQPSHHRRLRTGAELPDQVSVPVIAHIRQANRGEVLLKIHTLYPELWGRN